MVKKMKKMKWFLPLLLLTVLVISGCNKAKEMEDKIREKESKEVKQEEKVEQVVTSDQMQLVLSEVKSNFEKNENKGKATIQVKLKNNSEDDIPLHKEKNGLVSVVLRDEEGNVIYERSIKDDSKVLYANETKKWDVEALVEKGGEFTWEVALLVKNGDVTERKTISYDDVELTKKETFSWHAPMVSFLPKEEGTYVYNSQTSEMGVITEEILYLTDRAVQTYDDTIGTKVYFEDETGLYDVMITTGDTRENVIDQKDNYEKNQLIAYPIKVGKKWKSNEGTYEIIDANAEVETSSGIYSGVVVVQANFGTKIKYYYKENIGLIKAEMQISNEPVTNDWANLLDLADIN